MGHRHRHLVVVVSGFLAGSCSDRPGAGDTPATLPEDPTDLGEALVESQFQAYLPGLDEIVTYVVYIDENGAPRKAVIRADGRPTTLGDALSEERRAYTSRFGKLSPELWAKLRMRAAQDVSRIGLVFDPRVDPDLFEAERARADAAESRYIDDLRDARAAGREDPTAPPEVARADLENMLSQHVQAQSRAVVASVERLGASVVFASDHTPIVVVDATTQVIHDIAADPSVEFIIDAEAAHGRELQAPNGQTFHKVSTVMNAPPFNLDGQWSNGARLKVGFIEDAHVGLHDAHTAFNFAGPVSYSETPQACANDAGCAGLGGDTPAVCRTPRGGGQMRCVDPHLSECASQVFAAKAVGGTVTKFGASNAQPFVYNSAPGGGTTVYCNVTSMTAAYDHFYTLGVKTTNESWGCQSESVDGFIQDFNARQRGVFITKAAGDGVNTRSGCRPANALCVGGMTSANSISDDATQNPYTSTGQFVLDREEPDLVALSDQIQVMLLTGTTNWRYTNGTSYAAPLVAAMATLVKERCNLETLSPRLLRAMLLTGSWYYDPESQASGGLAFSTQPKPGGTVNPNLPGFIDQFGSFGKDYADGAGGPTGDNVLRWCDFSFGDLISGQSATTINTAPNSGSPFNPPGFNHGGYNIAPDGPPQTLSYDTDLRVAHVQSITASTANTRVRAVLAWDKCAPTTGPSGPYSFQNMTEDIDLFLCQWTGSTYGTCYGASRSVFDNKEGFDVTLPAAGTYRLVVTFENSASVGCNGSYQIPVALAWTYGPAASFVEAP